MQAPTSYSRNHRTLLVLDTTEGYEGAVPERFGRLLQSVNGANIKVDTVTLRNVPVSSGVELVSGSPEAEEDVDEVTESSNLDEVKRFAQLHGYTQVLFAVGV